MSTTKFGEFQTISTKAEAIAWMDSIEQTRPCDVPGHGPDALVLDRDKTLEETMHRGWSAPQYTCSKCEYDEREKRIGKALLHANVPVQLLQARFSNWIPRNPDESSNLEVMKKYAEKPVGALVMVGGVGTGKTHGAVAVMRRLCLHSSVLMYTQSELLKALRDTYSDKNAPDPIEKCSEASLLVIDELGVSVGGKDELPLLHSVIDERYKNQKPLILTSNLTYDELMTQLGDRLHDRVRGFAFAVLSFAGESHRGELREKYLAHTNHGVHSAFVYQKRINRCF